MDKIAAIACVKQEEKYISEWLDWHLSIGFSHFYLCDNNDKGYNPSLKSVVNEYIDRGEVTIIDCHGIKPIQPVCYNMVMDKYGDEYDWYAIIDVDEFIHTPKYDNNFSRFLEDFNYTDIVLIHWKCYDDNGLIHYDDKPVQERFTHPTDNEHIHNGKSMFVKAIVRKKSVVEKHLGCKLEIRSIHCALDRFDPYTKVIIKNVLGETWCTELRWIYPCKDSEYDVCYIKHYITKSLEEFIEIKRQRGRPDPCSLERYSIPFYKFYATITDNKKKFLEEKYGISVDNSEEIKDEYSM